MEEEKDGYNFEMLSEYAIMVCKPNQMIRVFGGGPAITSVPHTSYRRSYYGYESEPRSIFGFSNNLGADIAIASLLYF